MQNDLYTKGKKRTKKSKIVGISILAVVLLLVITVAGMFFNELRSLSSLKKVDDYGMFRMTYYGDYGFDDFLEVGAELTFAVQENGAAVSLNGAPTSVGEALSWSRTIHYHFGGFGYPHKVTS